MQKNVLEYLDRTLENNRNKLAIKDEKHELTFGELEQYSKILGSIIIQKYNFAERRIFYECKGLDQANEIPGTALVDIYAQHILF